MNFHLSDEEILVQRTAREYAERVLLPRASARDASGEFPTSELAELAELGLLGVNVDDELGGAGAGALAYSLALEEIARGDASVAVAVSVTNMVAELISGHGTPAQRREHVPKLVGGQYLCGSFALSEPQAGSDPAAMQTVAEKTAGGWRIRGTKQWISHGDRAGLLVVWAVTDKEAGHRGITAFLVRGGAPGLSVSRAEDKLGLRGSSTVQLAFDGVEVSDDDVLGAPGRGFALAMTALDGGRIGIASQALGIARGAHEAALRYATEREQFGVPIASHQAIGGMLAEGATALDAARLLTWRAAWLKAQGRPFSREAAMAKLLATERAVRVCDDAIQIHGGYGYTRDFPVERAYRDVRATPIYEGTSQIQRIVIARHLLRETT
jgi:alkylation response protein AidB-like acyl-CoA dehydrogenase